MQLKAVLDGHALICGACSEVLSVAVDWKKLKAEIIDAAIATMEKAAYGLARMPLEEEEQRHVTAAEGFLELGMILDADAELERVDPLCRHLPEVLEMRAKIYTALGKWDLLAVVAKRLWDSTGTPEWAPEWAHALRKSGAIESARAVLLDGRGAPSEKRIVPLSIRL